MRVHKRRVWVEAILLPLAAVCILAMNHYPALSAISAMVFILVGAVAVNTEGVPAEKWGNAAWVGFVGGLAFLGASTLLGVAGAALAQLGLISFDD